MILVFLAICFLYGYSILKLLVNRKVFDYVTLDFKEAIILCMPLGFLGVTVEILILTILNINLNTLTIWGGVLLQIIVINLLIRENLRLYNLKYYKFRIQVWDVLIIAIIINLALYAISSRPFLPDEFSHWALQAKNIFFGKSINSYIGTGLEGYPNYIPELAASYYFLANILDDTSIRLISTIHLILLVFNFYYIATKMKLNKSVLKVLIIIFLGSMPVFKDLASSFYADVIFACYYGTSVMYLMVWASNRNKNYFNLSILYLLGATWTKTDGFYLFIGQIIVLILIMLKNKQKNYKEIVKYSIFSGWLIILWKIYCIKVAMPNSNWNLSINPQYIKPMVESMFNQSFGLYTWVFINLLVILSILLNIRSVKNDAILIGILVMLGNVLFLAISYICMFGAEAITAASYSRYISRIVPIEILIIVLQYKYIVNRS